MQMRLPLQGHNHKAQPSQGRKKLLQGNRGGGLNKIYFMETSPLILIQLKIIL